VAFGQTDLTLWQIGYAVGYPIVCIGALAWTARVLFDRYVVATSGGM
jgi:fluoroquinolone transport system permease protein